ncbi:MAG: cation-translocating P-type ATPase [Candidatus Pacearchaeota archaeon]
MQKVVESKRKEWQAHALTAQEVMKKLGSSKNGLSMTEAKRRLAIYGKNEIKEVHKIKPFLIFLSQFNSFFIYLLLIAAVISIIMRHLIDFYAIIGIVFLNAALGFVQNYKAEKAIQKLKASLVQKAKVLRDGKVVELNAFDIVPGDILILEEGCKVVADARLIEAYELKADEAILTGESIPVEKTIKKLKPDVRIHERANIMFSGTSVVNGYGKAVVFATGMECEFGKIASLVQKTKKKKTPLQVKLDSFAKKLGVIVIFICIAIFLLGILLGLKKVEMLLTSISLAVAAVPEGLPAVVTICLAIAVRRMEKVNSLIRKLPAAETLGRVSVIASDKTGTITEEKMEVVKFFYDNKIVDASNPKLSESLTLLIKTGVLCNKARAEKINDEYLFIGDPTEQGLLRTALKLGFDKEKLTSAEPKITEFPFSSARKMMSVVRESKKEVISYVKGAPEAIVARSSYEIVNGKIKKLDEKRKKELFSFYESLANEGLRVLGFAFKKLTKVSITQHKAENKLIFIGFQALLDPPRPEVREAVRQCKQAGIEVKMITGDSLLTAIAVGKKIGLVGEAIDGARFDELSEEKKRIAAEKYKIFARIEPKQKLEIIELLKEQYIVAVTGDGINDAPALKRADIGIAMGKRGSDVTRDVADIVLIDDNFASIVKAVREGRRVFDNIKKFSYYLLSCNLAEILIILVGLLLGTKLGWPTLVALLPLQILWINLVTDGIIALSLSTEHEEADIMKRGPSSELFNLKVVLLWFLLALIIIAGLIVLDDLANSATKLQTITFTALVFFECFNALNFRSFTQPIYKLKQNYWLLAMITVTLGLQIGILSTPLKIVFSTTSLKASELALIFVVSSSIFILGEVFKFARLKIKSKK